jgi:hypothetical protein
MFLLLLNAMFPPALAYEKQTSSKEPNVTLSLTA